MVVRLAALLAAGSLACGARISRSKRAGASPAFDKAKFMATHNSYEKKPVGIVESLDLGVRMLEFDIYLHEFESRQEYCIGHWGCFGSSTQNGTLGNPDTHFLNAWLEQVRTWSLSHVDHAPITVMFDMKSDLAAGARPYAQGGFANLQGVMHSIFGESLYWASSKPVGSWPSVDQLRGKILVVLSGNTNSRTLYQQDRGQDPHAAINEAGLVLEAHDSGLGGLSQLFYWTGRGDGDDLVWVGHGHINGGVDAWPAIRDDNVVVVVSSSAVSYGLWSYVGVVDPATLEINWGAGEQYSSGRRPTCRVLADGRLEERHKGRWSGEVWVRRGTIDVANRSIQWESEEARQDLPLFDPVAYSVSGSRRAEAREAGGLVQYRLLEEQDFQLVRYPQMFFVDWQPGCAGTGENSPPLNQGAFLGVRRGCEEPPVMDGVATRVWQYSMGDASSGYGPGTFPATDEPDEAYKSWVLSFETGISY